MPSKRIIILEQQDTNTYRYAMWADVPAARQVFYADANAVSAWKDAQTADNTALQNGSVVERTAIFSVPATDSLNAIKARLQDLWTAFQNDVTNNNHWSKYGTFWDGTSWTGAGVS